jgi:hypothetical protein
VNQRIFHGLYEKLTGAKHQGSGAADLLVFFLLKCQTNFCTIHEILAYMARNTLIASWRPQQPVLRHKMLQKMLPRYARIFAEQQQIH